MSDNDPVTVWTILLYFGKKPQGLGSGPVTTGK